MKTVMVLSGGTSTAWHIAAELKKYFSDKIRLVICDINPEYLVHTSVLADRYLQVPPIKSPNYVATMLENMKRERVDILIPLIDDDIILFPKDEPRLLACGITSIAPKRSTIKALSNKQNMERTLGKMRIMTPRIFTRSEELDSSQAYFSKDFVGCGSKGVRLVNAREASVLLGQGSKVIQEACTPPEITVDVVRDAQRVYTICRERVEIKLGVSTKCRVFYDSDIQAILEQIESKIELPSVSCVQFMKNSAQEWTLIDFNLRSGGGTAISAAVGFQALRFAAAGWLGLPADHNWLAVPECDRYVVRTYTEIVTK